MPAIKQLFRPLRWYEASEYVLMMLMAISVPIHWRLGVWCMALLGINFIIKSILSRTIGNRLLSKPAIVCLCLMILYYLTYAISICYTNDPHEAWSMVFLRLPLLIFPLVFLLSDMSYLTRSHYKTIIYLLAAVLTIRFILLALRAAILSPLSDLLNDSTHFIAYSALQYSSLIFGGTLFNQAIVGLTSVVVKLASGFLEITSATSFKHFTFDNLHHNYLALYLITAIALLYSELIRHWKSPRWRKIRWAIAADMALLAISLIVCNSRSGLVVFALLVAICVIQLAFIRKQWLITGIIIGAVAVLVGTTYLASPKSFKRISDTAHNITKGDEGDVRQTLWASSIKAMKGHLLFGYGCEGYWDALAANYQSQDCDSGFKNEFNSHNQYLETALATGLVGLAVMLAMILAPAIIALRQKPRNLYLILFSIVYAGCMFFEASFGRQMGLLFICWWYGFLLLSPQRSHKKAETSNIFLQKTKKYRIFAF